MGYIDVSNVSLTLPDGRPLLEEVSFRVGEGATSALIGANGAGKSTLLRIIRGEVPAVLRNRGPGLTEPTRRRPWPICRNRKAAMAMPS